MATIVTRSGKGSALTHAEGDANFTNLNNDKVEQVDDLVELRARTPVDGEILYLKYHTTQGDGGHGVFRGITGAAPGTYTDDDGVTILPTGGDGSSCWRRKYSGAVNVAWFGFASASTIAGRTAAAQAAIDAAPDYSKVTFAGISGIIEELNVNLRTGLDIVGEGAKVSLNYNNQNSIINISSSSMITVRGFWFVGTSDTSALYNATYRHQGVSCTQSRFVDIHSNVFEKFSSFGVFVQNMQGGTFTEGANIHNNVFRDFGYDNTSAFQCGVLLSFDGEYSQIHHNKFFRIPSAVRCDDGANSLISDNIIMSLNGGDGTVQIDRAGIYAEANTNSGKLTITHNKINHNDTGLIPIIVKGDATKPQNAFIIESNDLLVNGSGAAGVNYGIVLYDAPNSRIIGNQIRPSSNTHPCIRLNTSENCVITNNYLNGGTYGVQVDATSTGVQYGSNVLENQATAKVDVSAGGTIINNNNRTYSFRISSAGAAGTPWDKIGWTVSRIGAGHYQIVHDIGTANYSVHVTEDNDTTPNHRAYSVVRGNTTLDIYVDDTAGTLTDENVLVTVNIGMLDPYVL